MAGSVPRVERWSVSNQYDAIEEPMDHPGVLAIAWTAIWVIVVCGAVLGLLVLEVFL